MATGTILDIQRIRKHDGPGTRTVVFFKGCPLDCEWCRCPDCRSFDRQLRFNHTLCGLCGNCVRECTPGAHLLLRGVHEFDPSKCRECFRCAEQCPSGALEAAGRVVTVEDVLPKAGQKTTSCNDSGDELIISGGEPLAQHRFTRDLLIGAVSRGIRTRIETCGFADKRHFLELAPLVDLFVWDIKDTDAQRHRQSTGAPLWPIIESLRAVDAAGGRVLLRCLLVTGANLSSDYIDGLASLYRELSNCAGIELLPYRVLGNHGGERSGDQPHAIAAHTPTAEQVSLARLRLKERWGIEAV